MPVDLSASIYAQYLRAYKLAVEEERKGHSKQAGNLYLQAAEFMRSYASYALDSSIKEKRFQKADSLAKAGRSILKMPEGATIPDKGPLARAAKGKSPETQGEEQDEYEAQIVQLITQTHVKWDDVGGLDDTKSAIKNAYFQALAKNPSHVKISSTHGILLYGPPGTGKTLLAAATAGSLDATFFNVVTSNMLSKWFGESTKLVSALFKVARERNPSVVFLDELESLSMSRSGETHSANLQIITTLLSELDGLSGKSEERFVLTIGATNVPWMLDAGVLSRFPNRVYIPLPDDAARHAIFNILLFKAGYTSKVPLDELVERTKGYSGRDIQQLCDSAVAQMSRRSNPDWEAVVERGRDAVREYTKKIDALNSDDFNAAFRLVKPAVRQDYLLRYAAWAEQTQN